MPDREKVKAFLTHLSLNAYEYKQSDDTVCGYDYLEVERIADDALDLLKKQEPMEPITDKWRNYICPVCGDRLRGGKFCMNCGQAVKWE